MGRKGNKVEHEERPLRSAALQARMLAYKEMKIKAGEICRNCHYYNDSCDGWGLCEHDERRHNLIVDDTDTCEHFVKWEDVQQ